jgi:hypothetical protein
VRPIQTIRFKLLANAEDSLRQAVNILAWRDIENEHARLKHGITNMAHAAELLLKERLRRSNPALIWSTPSKYPDFDARTVTTKAAIDRLKTIGVTFSGEDEDRLLSLRLTRNAIEHRWTPPVCQAPNR